MTDDAQPAARPTASLLPIGTTSHTPQPEVVEDEDWDIVHVGTADTPDHGAQALMRTSDGDFRISAAEVDGKVGLKIERYHPDETPDDSGDGDGDGDGDGNGDSDGKAGEQAQEEPEHGH
jgi:hypothetical protein